MTLDASRNFTPKLSAITDCPCDSGKPFAKCCARFLIQQQAAKTPEQLMRSRYSAYYLGGFGDYLLQTWHPATAQGLDAIELSKKTANWQGLQVIAKSQQGDRGEVEFKAFFLSPAGKQDCLHERSNFARVNGLWLYVGGEID